MWDSMHIPLYMLRLLQHVRMSHDFLHVLKFMVIASFYAYVSSCLSWRIFKKRKHSHTNVSCDLAFLTKFTGTNNAEGRFHLPDNEDYFFF